RKPIPMPRAMTTSDVLRAWAPKTGGLDLTDIDRCIEAASVMIEREVQQLFLTASVTESHDGSAAVGKRRSGLYTKYFPIVYPGSPVMTVTENGTALTLAQGYSTSADVLVYPNLGKLARVGSYAAIPIGWE